MEIVSVALLTVCVLALVYYFRRPPGDDAPPDLSAPDESAEARRQPPDAGRATLQLVAPSLQGSARVVDGDTVVIGKTRIRLFGIDAPEMNHPHGVKAKRALVSLCRRETVRAELVEQDVHGRSVARCYLQDGRDLSAEMVKLGLAIDWPKFSGGIYRSLETSDARRKLWLADARQKGRMHVWRRFEARRNARAATKGA